jgi:hypothetical protein
LQDEIADLDDMIEAIVKDLAPELLPRSAIGLNSAAQLLLTAGDNPNRLRSEASFATLCGVSPVPASSGKTVRHRLNRGGDRGANSAMRISLSGDFDWTLVRRTTSPGASQRQIRSWKQSAALNGTLPAKSSISFCDRTDRSARANSPLLC